MLSDDTAESPLMGGDSNSKVKCTTSNRSVLSTVRKQTNVCVLFKGICKATVIYYCISICIRDLRKKGKILLYYIVTNYCHIGYHYCQLGDKCCHIGNILLLKCINTNYLNTNCIDTQVQITEIHKYKLHKCRIPNYRITEITVK